MIGKCVCGIKYASLGTFRYLYDYLSIKYCLILSHDFVDINIFTLSNRHKELPRIYRLRSFQDSADIKWFEFFMNILKCLTDPIVIMIIA